MKTALFGLDTAAEFADTAALSFAAMGLILAAWSRETQAPVDDESRQRLVSWMPKELR